MVFKPGQSGNPSGAPKGKRISTWLVELGQLDELPDPKTLPINGQIAHAQLTEALTEKGVRSAEFVAGLTELKTQEPSTPAASVEAARHVLQELAELSKPLDPKSAS
jgi:hypothetical protein